MPIESGFSQGAVLITALALASACGTRRPEQPRPQEQIDAVEAPGSRPATPASEEPLPVDQLRLPEGFSIELYTAEVPNARSIAVGPEGVVYVSTREGSRIYAVLDEDGDRRADRVLTIASELDTPNGIAYRDGDLYVAEISRILRLRAIDLQLEEPRPPELVSSVLPYYQHHGWRYIRFGPDGWLYIGVGAPCNLCESEDPIYGSIARMRPDGTGLEVFARGIRNTVGFDWHPSTRELWFTDNGADGMGDDLPPDELNRAAIEGLHFGFPYCHGGDLLDPQFGEGRSCEEFEPPMQKLGPHVAALGMRFYTGEMFPERYREAVIIAEHGSWNRTIPIGYRVMVVRLEGGEAIGYEPLVEGFLDEQTGEAWGRPVDLGVLDDGSLLISDDRAGALYRLSYR
ncbi:MAG: sorbosone dehydrogenase family protein [Enhygromyxa sp.]